MDLFISFIALGLTIAVYMLPTIIAYSIGHTNVLAIGILNGAIGWTGIGWLGSLIWSVLK